MPIYEYICDECETQFERIVLNKTQEIACPNVRGRGIRFNSPCSARQMELDLRQCHLRLPLAEDRVAVAAAAVTDNPRGVLPGLNFITILEFLHAFRPS